MGRRLTIGIVASVFLCHSASAAGWLGFRQIESLKFMSEGLILTAEGGWNNANSCENSSGVLLQSTDANYDKAYALLLAAYAAGHEVTGYSDDCANVDGQSYNTIRGFKYLQVKK